MGQASHLLKPAAVRIDHPDFVPAGASGAERDSGAARGPLRLDGVVRLFTEPLFFGGLDIHGEQPGAKVRPVFRRLAGADQRLSGGLPRPRQPRVGNGRCRAHGRLDRRAGGEDPGAVRSDPSRTLTAKRATVGWRTRFR